MNPNTFVKLLSKGIIVGFATGAFTGYCFSFLFPTGIDAPYWGAMAGALLGLPLFFLPKKTIRFVIGGMWVTSSIALGCGTFLLLCCR